MQDLSALDTDEASLASQLREEDIRSIHLHHFANLVEAVKQDLVDLARGDHNVFDVDLDAHDQFSQLLLGSCNVLLALARDVDFVFTPSVGSWRRVAEDAREWRREVDGGVGGGLDELDILASTTTDEGMHGQLELHRIHVTFQLDKS